MRLWHKDLLPVLPRKQLLSQWRECCCIARNIAANGTPNHLLVNKIMDYPIMHFYRYGCLVHSTMEGRGYNADWDRFDKWFEMGWADVQEDFNIAANGMFNGWHNDRYLMQCFYNLQEKYDCGGITDAEWQRIRIKMEEMKYEYLRTVS